MRKHVHDLGTGMVFSLPLAAAVMLVMWALVELMTIVRPSAVGTDSTPEPIEVTTTVPAVREPRPVVTFDPWSWDPAFLDQLDVSAVVDP